MSNLKYQKYILTDLRLPENMKTSEAMYKAEKYNERATRVLWLEDEIMEGASSVIISWYWKATEKGEGTPSHTHNFDEVVGFIGSDYKNPHKLGAEVEFWIEDEQFILNESCLVFVPKGIHHCPLNVLKIEQPMLFLTFSTTTKYIKDNIVRESI